MIFKVFKLLLGLLPIFTCCFTLKQLNESKVDYLTKRRTLFLDDKSSRIGNDWDLTAAERKVNNTLMQYKYKDIANARQRGQSFPPSRHFFRAKEDIENSQVFQMIKKMPKGAVLHIHDISMVNVRWLVNQTYDNHCYMCHNKVGTLSFHFFKSQPSLPECDSGWLNVNAVRKQQKNVTAFDDMLSRNMTLIVDNPEETYQNQDAVWKKFENVLSTATGIIFYKPLFGPYFYEALMELYSDNVQYVEVRALLPQLYDLDGNTYPLETALELYIDTAQQFVKDFPNFLGAKFIYVANRNTNQSTMLTEIKQAIQIQQKYPGYVVGFDLVGQEDLGRPLLYYIDELLYPSQQTPPANLPYVFHAGETDWQGENVDENLLDALLLNTSRIGHGYAIVKHPAALSMVKDKQVAIEVNPISNQVLGLVKDLRNHPATYLIANDYPVVISSDDPAVWGISGLSYDYYETFMALAAADADLTLLKQLFINSIVYSAMTDEEKTRAEMKWQGLWDDFIKSNS